MRPSQGFGEQGKQVIYFRGTNRGTRPKFEGNKGTKSILGNSEHKKINFNFWEQGNKPIYFRGTREQVPPWEGLFNTTYISANLAHHEIFCDKGSLTLAMGKCLWFSVKIKVCQSSLSSP